MLELFLVDKSLDVFIDGVGDDDFEVEIFFSIHI